MFCVPVLIFSGSAGVGSRLHGLRSRTRFRRYRWRQVPFSCFAIPDSFSTVPRASSLVFMFYATDLILDGIDGIGSRFNVLRSRTRFRRFRLRWVPFSCSALPDSFSTIPRVSGPVFMFCVPEVIFGGTDGVRSRFHVLRSRTRFWQYGGRRVPFSSFARPNSFSTVPTASGPVFMFCASGHVFSGAKGVGSFFHVLRSRSRFGRFRGRHVPFSCFALPNSFSAVSRASGTRFGRYQRRLVLFSCFALPESFSAVRRESGTVFMFCVPVHVFGSSRESGPVFMFCAPGLVFGGSECVGCCFLVLRPRTHFRR
jgi:hypothetical protein